jgi:predicted nucleic acid-binding protein
MALSDAAADVDKRRIAQELMGKAGLALSAQVLQEFYGQATRTSRPDRLGFEDAREAVAWFARRPIQPTTVELVQAAINRSQVSYWDAAIIEAARLLGCAEVLSEDLNDGQDFEGVTIRNPSAD